MQNTESALSTQAIGAILIAAVLFTAMGAFVKILSQTLPSIEVAFFRNFFGLIWILVALYLHPPKQQTKGKPLVLFLRGFAGGSAIIAYFYNMSTMPLGTAYAFSLTSPIFLALFSILFLKQKVDLSVWVAIFIGFSGILLISNPKSIPLSFWGFLVGIYSGIGAALAYMSISQLAKYYDARIIVLSLMFWGSVLPLVCLCIPYSFAPIPLFESFVFPTFKEWLFIFGMGLVSTYAQIFLTKAYSLGSAPKIAAISYVNILFATIVGIMLGDVFPNLLIILGMVCITLGGILAVWKKRG